MSKELEALKSIKETILFSRVISGVEGAEHYYIGGLKSTKKYFDIIEKALNELEDAKHNYKALKEFYDNAVAYAAKIQEELNKYENSEQPLKDLATECVKYIKKNKPVDLWADTIKQLETGQYSYFIREMIVRYSSGVLLEYANRMLKKLDRSDEK